MKKTEFDKLLIEKSKQGRSDGAYSRLLGDEELGALISQIHATSISAGTFLENLISLKAPALQIEQIPMIFNGTLGKGVWIVSKKNLKQYVTLFLNLKKANEPDFLIVDGNKKECIVLELKDGDNFDTKKAKGEVMNLSEYRDALNAKLGYPWVSRIGVCMFHQIQHQKIVEGFKGHIKLEEAMSGEELCVLLGLSKEEIDSQRQKACTQNFNFLIQKLLEIQSVKLAIQERMEK